MLEKWIKKMKELFTDEVEEAEGIKHTTRETIKPDVKAKVRYEYPKNTSFRFPVIPDEQLKDRKDEMPAYKRKSSEPVKRKSMKPTIEEPPKETRKIYKKTDKPFQATDVPSPVYGFQKRNSVPEIEEVPAYQRKNRVNRGIMIEQEQEQTQQELLVTYEKAVNEEITNEIEVIYNEAATTIETEGITEPEITGTDTNVQTLNNHQSEETIFDNQVIEKSQTQTLIDESKKQLQEKREHVPKSEVNEPLPSKKEEKTGRNAFPFNVIMTPSDKKALRDKQREVRREQHVNKHQAHTPKKEEHHQGSYIDIVQNALKEEQKETYLPYHLLNDPVEENKGNHIWIEEQQELLEQTLKHFKVRAKVVQATQGPSVTRFEVHPEMGVKVSKIKNLSDDLKLNMAAKDIRIEAPIPGKNTVGIEIPNDKARMVSLQEIFETNEFKESTSPLTIALGLNIEGNPKVTNIQKMPHGLIAGATGSGKSVCINTILISILYKASYEDVKILLIDPKMVELAPYNGIPHLVAPVITDVKAATQSLKWAVNEMEDRYEKFVHEGVRNIEGYNKKILQQARKEEKMPFIIIIIDELADLMMTSPQDVEYSISRIAQKARACGIHLILATQRPSVDVITGLIKANIPTRISFSVSSQVDSRTIIDLGGAEKLLGKGDMLFVENGAGKSVRLQGPFISDEEIERVTNFARSLAEPNYLFEQEELLEQVHVDEEEDELLGGAIDFVISHNSASTSLLQRHFKIGYNRAARLIDTLENRGIISGQNGSKPRDILVSQKQEEI